MSPPLTASKTLQSCSFWLSAGTGLGSGGSGCIGAKQSLTSNQQACLRCSPAPSSLGTAACMKLAAKHSQDRVSSKSSFKPLSPSVISLAWSILQLGSTIHSDSWCTIYSSMVFPGNLSGFSVCFGLPGKFFLLNFLRKTYREMKLLLHVSMLGLSLEISAFCKREYSTSSQ